MKKVNESELVSSGISIRPQGHEDLLWLRPDKVIVVGQKSKYSATGTGLSAGSLLLSGSLKTGSGEEKAPDGSSNGLGETPEERMARLFPPSDAVQLSDIESIEYVKYFDPVTKEEKAKAIIKIRNSSSKKLEVQGVDARIYQP